MKPESTTSAAKAMQIVPENRETGQYDAILSDGELASCGCETLDPVLLQSAWEHAATFGEARGDYGSGDNNSNSNSRSHSSVMRVSPRENLDLRIFCGTWNVAGELYAAAVLQYGRYLLLVVFVSDTAQRVLIRPSSMVSKKLSVKIIKFHFF